MAAFHYVVAERGLECDAPFPELPECPVRAAKLPSIRVGLSAAPESIPRSVCWFDPQDSPAEPSNDVLRIGTFDEGYVVDYPGFGQFAISAAGDWIRCCLLPGIPEATARHMLLDKALPLALSLDGDVVLHAGGIAVEDCGLALVGASGRGKSTLVAYLGSQHAEALTDDCLVVRRVDGEWHAIPYYQGLRLWPESLVELAPLGLQASADAAAGEKRRIACSGMLRFRTSAVPLRTIVFLADPADEVEVPALVRLPPREAFFSLLAATFCLELRAAPALRNQFDLIGRLVDEVPAYALSFPRHFATLGAVGAAVLSTLSSTGAATRP